MTTLPAGLPVVVDRAGAAPLAAQISGQLEAAVTGGVLRAGDRLPSSRDLAATLGVSRTVVTNAYARLFAEGWLEGRHGSGTYVADVTPPSVGRRPGPAGSAASGPHRPPSPVIPNVGVFHRSTRPFPSADLAAAPDGADGPDWWTAIHARHPGLIDLQPGISWADGIEPAAWRRAWRQAGRAPAVPLAGPARAARAARGDRRLPAQVPRPRRHARAGPGHPGGVKRPCAARGRAARAGRQGGR